MTLNGQMDYTGRKNLMNLYKLGEFEEGKEQKGLRSYKEKGHIHKLSQRSVGLGHTL